MSELAQYAARPAIPARIPRPWLWLDRAARAVEALILLPQTLSEVTGPVFAATACRPATPT